MIRIIRRWCELNQGYLSIMVCGEGCPECTLSQAICDEMDTKTKKKAHTAAIVLSQKIWNEIWPRTHTI